jgi:hypothetical protein
MLVAPSAAIIEARHREEETPPPAAGGEKGAAAAARDGELEEAIAPPLDSSATEEHTLGGRDGEPPGRP